MLIHSVLHKSSFKIWVLKQNQVRTSSLKHNKACAKLNEHMTWLQKNPKQAEVVFRAKVGSHIKCSISESSFHFLKKTREDSQQQRNIMFQANRLFGLSNKTTTLNVTRTS